MNAPKSSILLVYTGGTIGMKEDPCDGTLRPFNFDSLLEEVPELGKFACRIDSCTFSPLIDSSDVEPSMWQDLARLIRDRYEDYDGFSSCTGPTPWLTAHPRSALCSTTLTSP